MAQINLYQTIEVALSSGNTMTLGSKVVPLTISLTGNGIALANTTLGTTTATMVYDSTTSGTGYKLFAIKSTTDAVVSWCGTTDNADTSSVGIEANSWFILTASTTTEHDDDPAQTRAGNTSQNITQIWVKPGTSGDIHFYAFK